MKLEHNIQKAIVLKLIHNPKMSFNELWGAEGDSNKFAYHLSKLESLGLVKKSVGGYSLTVEGRKLSAFIEGDSGEKALFPTINHFLIIKDGEKMLCQKRLKEPFYGYWGFISGKINFGWNVLECAKRDLKEETGLESDNLKLRGIEQTKTFENGELIHHHIQFIVEVSDISGNLMSKTHKAEHEWLTLDEFSSRKSFPLDCIKRVFSTDKFLLLEVERVILPDSVTSRIISEKML